MIFSRHLKTTKSFKRLLRFIQFPLFVISCITLVVVGVLQLSPKALYAQTSTYWNAQRSGTNNLDFFFTNAGNPTAPYLSITSTGNVGIGTTIPGSKFQVYDAPNLNQDYISSNLQFMVANPTAAAYAHAYYGSVINAYTGGGGGVTSLVGQQISYGPYSGQLVVGYGLIIQPNAYNSIMTNSYGLYVNSPAVNNTSITSQVGIHIAPQSVTGVTNPGYGIYQMGITDLNYFGGNVGIGVVPTTKFEVTGNSKINDHLDVGIGHWSIPVGSGGNMAYNAFNSYGSANIYGNTINVGSLEVGDWSLSNSAYKFEVKGQSHLTNLVTVDDNVSIGAPHWASQGVGYLALDTFGGALIRGNSLNVGTLGVGEWGLTAGCNPCALEVAGNAHRTDAATTWTNPSDVRLKKNIHTLDGSLEKLLQLRGVSFEWKNPEKFGNKGGMQMGFVAQDVEKVFPQWVGVDNDGYKNLTISGFEGLSVEAFRELKNENDQLKNQLEQEKARNDAQDQEIAALKSQIQSLVPTAK